MAKKPQLTTLNLGDLQTIQPDSKLIRFEGTNEDFFWRLGCEHFKNMDAEIVIPPTHQCVLIVDGQLQDIKPNGRHRIFPEPKRGLFGIKKKEEHDVQIIFMNKTIKFYFPWKTVQPIDFHDPLTEIPVHLKAEGRYEVRISDPLRFYQEIVGTLKQWSGTELEARLGEIMVADIRPHIAKYTLEHALPYTRISSEIHEMTEVIRPGVEAALDHAGLELFTLIITGIDIEEEEKIQIEYALKKERAELKEKKDAKEIAAELERLSDKQFEREIYLRKLESADREKFNEVLKILGWPKGEDGRYHGPAGHFCPSCGHSYEEGQTFCENCGTRLADGKACCPRCHQEVSAKAAFCPHCGTKLHR